MKKLKKAWETEVCIARVRWEIGKGKQIRGDAKPHTRKARKSLGNQGRSGGDLFTIQTTHRLYKEGDGSRKEGTRARKGTGKLSPQSAQKKRNGGTENDEHLAKVQVQSQKGGGDGSPPNEARRQQNPRENRGFQTGGGREPN